MLRGDVHKTSALREEVGKLANLQTNSTDRLREMQMKGGGVVGQKIPKILQTSYVHAP